MQQANAWQQLTQRIDPHATLLRTWPLAGGISAQTTALEIQHSNGETRRYVVRVHGEADRRANPNIAADEFRLLQIVRAHGIAAPAPIDFDLSGQIFPTPYIVLEYIEGETDSSALSPAECSRNLAAQLAAIHTIDAAHPGLSFLPRREDRVAARLASPPAREHAWFLADQIHAALDGGRAFTRRNRPTLLHGDYWPSNVLWQGERLAAVIDWEDAATGDPLADLANSKLEILWKWGAEAAEEFTRSYIAHRPLDLTDLPLWELYAALRHGPALANWGLDAATEAATRAHLRRLVEQSLAAL